MKTIAFWMIPILAAAQEERPPSAQMSIDQVIEKTTALTGTGFLIAGDVPLQKFISFPEDLLTPQNAVAACTKLCREAGLAVVRTKEGERILWRIVQAPLAGRQDLVAYERVEDLPPTDEFCRLQIKMKNLSPREAHAVVINLVSQPQAVIPNEPAGMLLLSDYASMLRSVAGMIRSMDEQTPRLPRSEYLVTFCLLKATGTPGVPATELPPSCTAYADLLKAHAPFSGYELADVSSARVNLGKERTGMLPGQPASDLSRVELGIGGSLGYEVNFHAFATQEQSIRFKELVLLAPREKTKTPNDTMQEALRTSFTLRDGERALVGTCRPETAAAPMILVAELRALP